MKKLKGLCRLTTLTLLALTLMAAMALPSAAAKVCSATQMLAEVEIVSVAAKESPAVWSTQGLVNFDYGGDIENGLLEVRFKDIATDFDFDGYVIEAVPGDDDPGNSKELGVPDYKSPELIARPPVVGDTITEVLNLEPGTKYYVTVHAVNHNTVRISPDQRAQDSRSATTLLSAPFLGALRYALVTHTGTAGNEVPTGATCDTRNLGPPITCSWYWYAVDLNDDDFQGTHFAFYGARNEADQHYFRWLNPAYYGPYDHIRGVDHNYVDGSPPRKADQQADMLSMDKDGDVEDHCDGAAFTDGDCGHTHYQFKAVDENGNIVASELYETNGILTHDFEYFQTVFTAEKGNLTLSVSLGRKVGGKYKQMSDVASVTFEAPDDLRALDQTYDEYRTVNDDIVAAIKDNEDAERWLGEKNSGDGRSIWNYRPDESLDDLMWAEGWRGSLEAHLNNQLK